MVSYPEAKIELLIYGFDRAILHLLGAAQAAAGAWTPVAEMDAKYVK